MEAQLNMLVLFSLAWEPMRKHCFYCFGIATTAQINKTQWFRKCCIGIHRKVIKQTMVLLCFPKEQSRKHWFYFVLHCDTWNMLLFWHWFSIVFNCDGKCYTTNAFFYNIKTNVCFQHIAMAKAITPMHAIRIAMATSIKPSFIFVFAMAIAITPFVVVYCDSKVILPLFLFCLLRWRKI